MTEGLECGAADGVAATHLPQHEDAEDDLYGVVDHQDGVQLQGLPVGHQTRTEHQHQVQVHCHDYHCRYWTLHEGPVVDPGICNSQCSLLLSGLSEFRHQRIVEFGV